MDAHPEKRAGEKLDYTLRLHEWLSAGRTVDAGTCEIVGSSIGESPLALQFLNSPSVELATTATTSPNEVDALVAHLQGGTPGVTYYLKWTWWDNGSPQLRGVRYTSLSVVGEPLSLLVVEDGTEVTSANSYVSRAFADAYFNEVQDTVWLTADVHQREAALVKATRYLEQKYRLRWRGARAGATQVLSWPRRGVPIEDFFDPDSPYYTVYSLDNRFDELFFVGEATIPVEVKHAQLILARLTLDSSGVSNVALQEALTRPVKRAKLGSLEVEYASSADMPAGARQSTLYWDVEQSIAVYLKPRRSSGVVARG